MITRNAAIIASRLPQLDLQLWLLQGDGYEVNWRLVRVKDAQTGDREVHQVDVELTDYRVSLNSSSPR